MHIIISGSRTISDMEILSSAIFESGFPIDVVIHGDARGIDSLAKKWCKINSIPAIEFKAHWLEFGKKAGPLRNYEMIKYAKENCECGGALVAIWDGESRGTFNTIMQAHKAGLRVFVKTLIIPGPENLKRRGIE